MDLGRFQQGQQVTLGIATVDGSGNPVAPNAAPTVTITPPTGSPFTLKLAMNGGSTAFSLPVFLGLSFGLGTYSVAYSYQAGAFAGSGSDTFEVIAGGDPGGAVISLCSFDRPEARYVVAHTTAGLILQGRNPQL